MKIIQAVKRRHGVSVFALCFLGLSLAAGARAAEGLLAEAYSRFLTGINFVAGTNSQGFAAFTREIIRDGTPIIKDQFAFCWSDTRWVVANSSNAHVTNVNDLSKADQSFWGFDGEFYWRLSLNIPTGAPTSNGLPAKASQLSIHPKADAHPVVTSTRRECWRVLQFGFTSELREPPRIVGSDMILNGVPGAVPLDNTPKENVRVKLIGRSNHPDRLDYDKEVCLRVSLDYPNDALTFEYFATNDPTRTVVTVHSKILAVSNLAAAPDNSVFNWRKYLPPGQVTADLVTLEGTRRVKLDDKGNFSMYTLTPNGELIMTPESPKPPGAK